MRFDGFDGSRLLEAKGPGYANFVKDGKFQHWFTGVNGIIEQATRQASAANGMSIEWHVAELKAVQVFQNLINNAGLSSAIKVIYTPPVG